MNIGMWRRLALACACAFGAASASAADGIETRPLRFAKGASAATVKGTLKGSQTIDYKVGAKAGQTMTVGLKTSNGANYFNVLPPGSNDVAVFVGSTDGNDWTAKPAAAGAATPDTAMRAGEGRFDATGSVPCAQAKGQPTSQCAMGVARAGGGTATVAVTRPDGRKRFIFFEKGKATGADVSQADGNLQFRAKKEADLYLIQVGDERYEIVEAVVFGG
ncbi:MAG: hypothetical protein U1F58_07200 [Burkholderiales bacterium]